MAKGPLICGFLKARNEIIRGGNLYRAVEQLKGFCDTIVACDDASYDGTREYLQDTFSDLKIPQEQLILVPAKEHDFKKELFWKQKMMDVIHGHVHPQWIWWHDGDEELEPDGAAQIQDFCRKQTPTEMLAFRAHYAQIWRNKSWYRLDDGFNDGHFIKLWRWDPGLFFDIVEKTHHAQFPQQLFNHLGNGRIGDLPWRVIHWGNWGVNLRWKAIQYFGGLGGVERHISYEKAEFGKIEPKWSHELRRDEPKPQPYSEADKQRIRSLRDLKSLDATFTVVIPTYNRAKYLPETLRSLQRQTYDKWVAVVLDDGSTDKTQQVMEEWQERDPRIFYARYKKLGAVAINEIGMDIACNWSEFWTRLGSDDYFEPHKLELDAMALSRHEWTYGPYRVLRDGQFAEMCNLPMEAADAQTRLKSGQFLVSWANCAARTSLLKKVKDKYGRYCDPTLRNMEDFLINTRLARFAAPVFRAQVGASVIVSSEPSFHDFSQMSYDAIWRVNPVGASADTAQTGSEDQITREIIERDNQA